MIDTHCHLNSIDYKDDLDAVIENSIVNGVEKIIVPSTTPDDMETAVEIIKKYNHIYAALGIHPHDADKYDENVVDRIKNLVDNYPKRVAAIGEIGLDFYYNLSPVEMQKQVLIKQLILAKELNLPVIIHNRDSDAEMLEILNKYYNNTSCSGVIHCFSSDINFLDKVLNLGLYVSFTCNITFKSVLLDDVIEQVPMDKVLLETDSPYMTPAPNRGKRNVPENIAVVAEKISKVKNIKLDKVIEMTTNNAKKLFRLALFLLMFCLTSNIYAQQNTAEYEDEYIDEEYDENYDPYHRVLGIGAILGSNTFVDQYETGLRNVSSNGLFTYGGAVNYRFLPAWILQGSYMYSKNTKHVDELGENEKDLLDPNIHQTLELSVIGMLKPRDMVNFYALLGATYFMNKRYSNPDGLHKQFDIDNKLGLNTGIGASVNINAGKAGVFTLFAEWKVGFRFDKITLNYDPRLSYTDPNYLTPTRVGSFASVPRGGVMWYMPFF